MEKLVTILITGATGYIGGAILTRLLSHPNRSNFTITAIVRDSSKATRLQGLGVKAVVGSHNDRALVTPLAAASDVVITAANVDDMEAAEAIMDGMKQRQKRTSVAPILIHTSGTAVLGDDARGMHGDAPVYSDMDLPLLDSIPATQPHREVDLAVLKADQQGYLRAWIVIPSTIWGRASGPLVEADIMNPKSQQIPRLINISLTRGRAGMVGKGANFWPNVEISELANLYILIFDRALSSSTFKHGREGLFFGANGEHKLYDVSQAIGDALVKIGRADKAQPTILTSDEITSFFGPPPGGIRKANGSYGSNSRARADRGYNLGWKPAKGTQEMLDGITDEVQAVIADEKHR